MHFVIYFIVRIVYVFSTKYQSQMRYLHFHSSWHIMSKLFYWRYNSNSCKIFPEYVELHASNKGKFHPTRSHEPPTGGVEVQLHYFLKLGARWKWVVNGTPRPFYPQERDPVPFVQEAGWASGRVWTGEENLAPTGIRSPDHPNPSESLYQLRYPDTDASYCMFIFRSSAWDDM